MKKNSLLIRSSTLLILLGGIASCSQSESSLQTTLPTEVFSPASTTHKAEDPKIREDKRNNNRENKELEKLKAEVKSLQSEIKTLKKQVENIEGKPFQITDPSTWMSGLGRTSNLITIASTLSVFGIGVFAILKLDDKYNHKDGIQNRNISNLNKNLSLQKQEIGNLTLKLEAYSRSIEGLKSEWKDDIRQSLSNTISLSEPVVPPIENWSYPVGSGNSWGGSVEFSQPTPPPPPPIALQEAIRAAFGRDLSYFRADTFQPMRSPGSWQGRVDETGSSAFEIEVCSLAEASYLLFTDAGESWLIPNAANSRLRQQLLQLSQESSGLFEIQSSLTGEIRLIQAARVSRTGAGGWRIEERGQIEV